jgi:hypothetical protein
MDSERAGLVICSLGIYHGSISPAVCGVCTDFNGPVRGIGDRIAKVTDAFHIPKCGGCKKRQIKWNGPVTA